MENFLRPLDICTKIPPTTAMSTALMKILIELLYILALGKQPRQVDSYHFGKNARLVPGSI